MGVVSIQEDPEKHRGAPYVARFTSGNVARTRTLVPPFFYHENDRSTTGYERDDRR